MENLVNLLALMFVLQVLFISVSYAFKRLKKVRENLMFVMSAAMIVVITAGTLSTVYQSTQVKTNYSKKELVELVKKYSDKYKVPFTIANGLFTEESGYKVYAVSNKAAMGLGQIIPATFVAFCEKGDNPFDPEDNIKVSLKYLRNIYDHEGKQNWTLSIQKYNGGNKYFMSKESVTYAMKVLSHAEFK